MFHRKYGNIVWYYKYCAKTNVICKIIGTGTHYSHFKVRSQRYTDVNFHIFPLKQNLRSHGMLIFCNLPISYTPTPFLLAPQSLMVKWGSHSKVGFWEIVINWGGACIKFWNFLERINFLEERINLLEKKYQFFKQKSTTKALKT